MSSILGTGGTSSIGTRRLYMAAANITARVGWRLALENTPSTRSKSTSSWGAQRTNKIVAEAEGDVHRGRGERS